LKKIFLRLILIILATFLISIAFKTKFNTKEVSTKDAEIVEKEYVNLLHTEER
jgi:hypothetical protein